MLLTTLKYLILNQKIETYIIDSFTDTAFKGNPAGVCILEERLVDDIMLSIAQELNLSETAFVLKKEDATYTIQYFSPKMEIPLCGHATLASAKILFKKNPLLNEIKFITIEQLDLIVTKDEEFITMKFPLYDTNPIQVSQQMLDALGIEHIVNSVYNEEVNSILIEISDCNELRSLTPNFERLINSNNTIDGVVVTAQSKEPEYTFESRYFWPWSGSNEDPVTGATHTFLAKYWQEKLNMSKMTAFQCSSRTGVLELDITDGFLLIKGKAQIVLEGQILL